MNALRLSSILSALGTSLFVAAFASLAAPLRAQCTQWAAFGSGVNNTSFGLAALPSGGFVIGGAFTQAGGVAASRIAIWNGSAWSALGSGLDNSARAVTVLPNGDVIAAGDFAMAGGMPVSRVARWDGTAWSPLGSGVSSLNQHGLFAATTMPNGDVVVGGFFTIAGGSPANAIARWNGSSWSPLGSGILATVFALLPLPNGDLIAGGNFATAGGVNCNRIARWNGSTWSPLGSGMSGFRVNSIARLPNGDLVAGGAFTSAGGTAASNIARWNGSTWSPLGSGTNGDVLALVVMPDGDIIAGGQFTTAGGVAALGGARWDGSTWTSLGFSGLAQVYGATVTTNEDRVFGGFFSTVGGVGAGRVARLQSTCPATVAPTAPACTSSAGLLDYVSTTSPWIGADWASRCTGLPSTAVVAVITGFATTDVPLNLALPSPLGCSLLVTPVVTQSLTVNAGAVDTVLSIPEQPGIVGLVLHRQILALELDALGQTLLETTASNRLTATVGDF